MRHFNTTGKSVRPFEKSTSEIFLHTGLDRHARAQPGDLPDGLFESPITMRGNVGFTGGPTWLLWGG
jgi:hypothetical protein